MGEDRVRICQHEDPAREGADSAVDRRQGGRGRGRTRLEPVAQPQAEPVGRRESACVLLGRSPTLVQLQLERAADVVGVHAQRPT